jgi:hypothetical protein
MFSGTTRHESNHHPSLNQSINQSINHITTGARRVTRQATPQTSEAGNAEAISECENKLADYDANPGRFAADTANGVLLKKAAHVLMLTLGQVANFDPAKAASIMAHFASNDMMVGTEEDAKASLFGLAKDAFAGAIGLSNSRAAVPCPLKRLKKGDERVQHARKTGAAHSALIAVLSTPQFNLEYCRRIKAALEILLGLLNNRVATSADYDFVIRAMTILGDAMTIYDAGQAKLFGEVENLLEIARFAAVAVGTILLLLLLFLFVMSLSLSYSSIASCLHSLTLQGTSLTINHHPLLLPSNPSVHIFHLLITEP